ncbi:MAG TPA: phosphomannomutase, partial [Blastocatellia bacterium]|nr:phosphomannomutase [Blastocatellia bacterium]
MRIECIDPIMDSILHHNIFREYDIRGIAARDLAPEAVALISKAIGTFFRKNGAKRIAVGFDCRESSPRIYEILTQCLTAAGCDVFSVRMVPTPVLYYAVHTGDIEGGVMITGS